MGRLRDRQLEFELQYDPADIRELEAEYMQSSKEDDEKWNAPENASRTASIAA